VCVFVQVWVWEGACVGVGVGGWVGWFVDGWVGDIMFMVCV
jgi:hypothetical protein